MHLSPPALALAALALPLSVALPSASPRLTSSPLPLIIWHGLGDRYDAPGLATVASLAEAIHPSTPIYTIRLSSSGTLDSRATFLGNLTTQLTSVCDVLSANTSLHAATTRIDALGFSQGGQFLRGLIERCPGISVRSLVTFGSQHNGIARFQECGRWDLVCQGAMAAIRGNAWAGAVQGGVVPAQYYREVDEVTGEAGEKYLASSNFLADVNNEREVKSREYGDRIAAMERFAMYVFEEDRTVIPKESGWFAEVNMTDGVVTRLRDRRMYGEDWLGLRRLDEKGGLVFRSAPGAHMRLTDKVLVEAFTDFFGPEREFERAEDRVKWEVDGGQEVFTFDEL